MSEVRNVHVTSAGLTIESSGTPGSLVAALSSVDDSQNIEVDVPLVSRSVRSGEGGNHPFRLDKEFRSIAYLTNITQKPTKVAVIIFHDGGMYTPELMSVAAGATLAIDLLQLRDSQAKDIQGRALPIDLAQGQFFWHPHQGEALVGRVVTFDVGIGTASNFSCPNCCQQEPSGLVFIPAPVSGLVGGYCQLTVNEYETYCGQYTVGPYNYTNSVSYSCNNMSVATVSSTGMVSCVGWGTATVTASLDYYHSDYISAEDCGLFLATLTSALPIVVVQVAFQKSDGTALPSPLRMGISATTLGGVTHDRTQHLRAVITPANEAANVTITSNNKLTVTQGTTSNGVINFDCVGKNQSGSHGDGTIKANHTGMVIGTAAVDVLVPHNVSATHDTTGGGVVAANLVLDASTSPGWVCLPAGQVKLITGYYRFLNITVCDQFGGLMGDLYEGAEVSEFASCDNQYHSINQPLTTSSTYVDPTGLSASQTNGSVVPAGSPEAQSWPSQPLITFQGSASNTDNIGVRVDGFQLNPGIVNRQWTISSSPPSVTIAWP
jgi:Big-like domain-containing protein